MRQIGYNAFWSGGLGLGAERDNTPAAGPALTAPGSIDVSTFKIGTTQTITAGTATASGGGTVTIEIQHLSDGDVKSTSAAYAHVAGDDTEAGLAQWRAVETGGTNPGATPWQAVASGVITYPAPTAAGGLVDQSFTENSGVQTYNASGDFTGSALVYSLTTAPAGVTINSGTGVVSFDTDALSQQTGTSIVVTATNSGGSVNSGFSLAITAGNSAPVISGVPTISGSAVEGQTLTATAASVTGTPTPTRTWQWLRNTTAISGATNSTYAVQAADIGNTISVRQTETNVAGSANATSAATATVTGQQIAITSGPTFNGTNTISMSVNRAGTIYWMITDNATETAAAIIAGTGAIDGGNFAVTSGSNNATIAYPNVTAGDHYLHIVADAATSPGPSAVDSTQYTFPAGDTTAPTLTSPTDAANGQTASTGSVSTNEDNGTLYWVVTTSATAPSAAQVKAGQDNTGTAATASGSQAVSATGVQNITPSGLTAGTQYTTHFMHEDAATNQSGVSSASGFTTAAAGNPELLPDSGIDTASRWFAPGGCTIQNSSAEWRTAAAFATLYTSINTSSMAPVSGSTSYTVSVDVANFTSGGNFQLGVSWYDSSLNLLSTDEAAVNVSGNGTFSRVPGNSPANAAYASFRAKPWAANYSLDFTTVSIKAT